MSGILRPLRGTHLIAIFNGGAILVEEAAPAEVRGHSIVYAPRIQDLLAREEKVFRIDATTVGVSDCDLMAEVVAERPVLSTERSVYKPAAGAEIPHDSATRTIRALGQDVMEGIRTPPPPARGLDGAWPYAATSYLRQWLFASDPLPVSLLSKRRVTRSHTLSRIVDRAITVWPEHGGGHERTALAEQIRSACDTQERRQAIAMYRRATATLCDGVAALAGNALWLLGPAREQEEARGDLTAVLWETLRLLPPAWMLYRTGGEAYTGLHPEIRPEDNVALFPLLMHRHPDYWSDPMEFRPERWAGVADPEKTPAFMPFGFDGARCWAKHLVVPLAERLLTVAFDNRLAIRSLQQETHVPLRSLLSVRFDAETGA
ncbi:cytochrome P450 [Streptomyces laculatispora]|uniref:Cytochrome P450 n=1 Tax=Streptomyces laculatispora TaxID=887464 RepID=A0ABY9I001_9ACTN|nr:cytochrome P450 [Streptomyces laculatispora]WLQ39644.1 cytochrome P450 [Streptomyces laculatispora]